MKFPMFRRYRSNEPHRLSWREEISEIRADLKTIIKNQEKEMSAFDDAQVSEGKLVAGVESLMALCKANSQALRDLEAQGFDSPALKALAADMDANLAKVAAEITADTIPPVAPPAPPAVPAA